MGQIFEARIGTQTPLIKKKICSMLKDLVQAYNPTCISLLQREENLQTHTNLSFL